MKLNDDEQQVMMFLGLESEPGYYGFAGIIDNCIGLDRKRVRRACRSLARKGLLQFGRGLWTEDGEPAGSGYGATTDGKHWAWNQLSAASGLKK